MAKGQEMTRESVNKIFSEVGEILVKKNQDYRGASFDLGLQGNFVHLWDKMQRLRNMIHDGNVSNFEGVEDTYRDIIGYCVIGLHILNPIQQDNKVTVSKLDVPELKRRMVGKYPEFSGTLIEDIVNETLNLIENGKNCN